MAIKHFIIFGFLLYIISSCNGNIVKGNNPENDLRGIELAGQQDVVENGAAPLTHSYWNEVSTGNHKLLIKTVIYRKDTLKITGDYNESGAILDQSLYFLKHNDTIRIISFPSRKITAGIKNSEEAASIRLNAVSSISIIQGKQDFFYYITGKEDCEYPCSEYWSFYSKAGEALWEIYEEETGDYAGTLEKFGVSESIYSKNSISKTKVYPFELSGKIIPASLIKPGNPGK